MTVEDPILRALKKIHRTEFLKRVKETECPHVVLDSMPLYLGSNSEGGSFKVFRCNTCGATITAPDGMEEEDDGR